MPAAALSCLPLDLTDAGSVAAFADAYRVHHCRLGILLNNAGVVKLPTLQHAPDGIELHMTTNHFGHFALTCRLFALLCRTPGARVVTLTSGLHRLGAVQMDDLDRRKCPYGSRRAYGDSKLANLLFTRALQQRFAAARVDAVSVAARPGPTATARQQATGLGGGLARRLASRIETGVAPQLYAATGPDAVAGALYDPRFFLAGPPVLQQPSAAARDDALAERLWAASEDLAGCCFA